jgi:hypothetical protein
MGTCFGYMQVDISPFPVATGTRGMNAIDPLFADYIAISVGAAQCGRLMKY